MSPAHGRLDRLALLAHEAEQPAELLGLVGARSDDRARGFDRAAEHAREADPTDVGVALHAEHGADERVPGPTRDRLAVGVGDRDHVRRRTETLEELEDGLDALVVQRIADEDRDDGPRRDGTGHQLVELLLGQLLGVEVLHQELLVLTGVHDPVLERLAPLALGVEDRPAHLGEVRTAGVRQLDGHADLADRAAQLTDQLVEVGVLAVEVGDDDRTPAAERARRLHLGAQVVGGSARTGDDADDEVGAEHGRLHLADELRVARRVHEGPALVAPFRINGGHLQRVLLLLLFGLRIADARLLRDRSLPCGGSRQERQGLDQRGLAGGGVADEGDVTGRGRATHGGWGRGRRGRKRPPGRHKRPRILLSAPLPWQSPGAPHPGVHERAPLASGRARASVPDEPRRTSSNRVEPGPARGRTGPEAGSGPPRGGPYSASWTTISTRRLRDLPSALSLPASGRYCP